MNETKLTISEQEKNAIYNTGLYYHLKKAYHYQDRSDNKDSQEKQILGGSYVTKKAEIVNMPEKLPDLKTTLQKIKPFLSKTNEENAPKPGQNFLTFPIFKVCLKEDIQQHGYLWENHIVLILEELFTELTRPEVYQLSALGRYEKLDILKSDFKIDYMALFKKMEDLYYRISK